MRIQVAGLLLLILAAGFTDTAQAQDIALAEHRSRVQIPRAGQGPYVLEVHVPAQTLRGDQFRVSFRRPLAGSAPVNAFGRVQTGQGQQVAIESLTLQVEGFEVDAAVRTTEIYGFSHEVISPRDAPSTGAAPARAAARRIRLTIPLPDVVLADLSAATTAADGHKEWINLLSVSSPVPKPGSGTPASGGVKLATALTGTAPPPRLEFDVEMGALQRELALAHREGSALVVEVRGWDPDSKHVRTYKLQNVFVKKYQLGRTGARVVIETGPPAGSMRAPARSN